VLLRGRISLRWKSSVASASERRIRRFSPHAARSCPRRAPPSAESRAAARRTARGFQRPRFRRLIDAPVAREDPRPGAPDLSSCRAGRPGRRLTLPICRWKLLDPGRGQARVSFTIVARVGPICEATVSIMLLHRITDARVVTILPYTVLRLLHAPENPIASGQDQAAIPRARARRSGVQPPGARPAQDRRVPALERLRFLCILSSTWTSSSRSRRELRSASARQRDRDSRRDTFGGGFSPW